MEQKICEQCGKEFKPRHKKSRFCSKRCLWDNNKTRTPHNKGKGNGWVDKRGYHWDYVTEYGKRVARRKHRIIMENHLGRKLEPCELVHHINGDTSDNRIENLSIETWPDHTAKHSTGSRRDIEAKKSMERFALMREELKRERVIKKELLHALEMYVGYSELSGAAEGLARIAQATIAKAYGEEE